jgi:hypothetical protein
MSSMVDDLNRQAALAGYFKKARALAIDVASLEGRLETDDPRELDVDASLFHYDLLELREQLDEFAKAGEIEGLTRTQEHVEAALDLLGEIGVRIDEAVVEVRQGPPSLAPLTAVQEPARVAGPSADGIVLG